MTYQLTANVLAATGVGVREVRITRLVEGTFYAVLSLDVPGGSMETDARPSDALNLALVIGAPILVGGELLGLGRDRSHRVAAVPHVRVADSVRGATTAG